MALSEVRDGPSVPCSSTALSVIRRRGGFLQLGATLLAIRTLLIGHDCPIKFDRSGPAC